MSRLRDCCQWNQRIFLCFAELTLNLGFWAFTSCIAVRVYLHLYRLLSLYISTCTLYIGSLTLIPGLEPVPVPVYPNAILCARIPVHVSAYLYLYVNTWTESETCYRCTCTPVSLFVNMYLDPLYPNYYVPIPVTVHMRSLYLYTWTCTWLQVAEHLTAAGAGEVGL